MNQEPVWLESLRPSAGSAPEMPAALLGALRARRQSRRAAMAAGSAAVLAVASAVWVAMQPGSVAPLHPAEVVVRDLDPGSIVWEPPIDLPNADSLTIVSFYRIPGSLSIDLVPTGGSGAQDQALRIGDHWDPERVRAWVLD